MCMLLRTQAPPEPTSMTLVSRLLERLLEWVIAGQQVTCPGPQTLDPRPWTLDPRRPDPKPWTLDPRRPDPTPKILDALTRDPRLP
eukprot:2342412-Rhodomonas_salina.1